MLAQMTTPVTSSAVTNTVGDLKQATGSFPVAPSAFSTEDCEHPASRALRSGLAFRKGRQRHEVSRAQRISGDSNSQAQMNEAEKGPHKSPCSDTPPPGAFCRGIGNQRLRLTEHSKTRHPERTTVISQLSTSVSITIHARLLRNI